MTKLESSAYNVLRLFLSKILVLVENLMNSVCVNGILAVSLVKQNFSQSFSH